MYWVIIIYFSHYNNNIYFFCVRLGTGLLEKGEIGISATNRNFKGRMGSRDADVYLGLFSKFF